MRIGQIIPRVPSPHAPSVRYSTPRAAAPHIHMSAGPGNAMARAAATTRQENVLALDSNMHENQTKGITSAIADKLLARLNARK